MPVIRGPLVDYMYVVDEEAVYDGSKITIEGKHGSWFWVILEGTAEVAKETPEGPVKILRIGEGAFVGSISSFLVSGSVRSATILAVSNVQLGVLDSQRLSQEFARLTPEFRGFLVSLDKRLKQLNEQALELRQNKRNDSEIADNRKPVIKQGTTEDSLYIIREGTAAVVRHEEHGRIPLAQLYKGDFFGRVPFLEIAHEPEYASVMASKDLKVRKVDLAQLQNEYNQLSTTFKNFVDNVSTCVAVTTKVVCQYQKKFSAGR